MYRTYISAFQDNKKAILVNGFDFWYCMLCEYRANHYDDLISLRPKIDSFYEKIGAIVSA